MSSLVCVSGFALIQLEGLPQLQTGSVSRDVVYWLHIALPFAAVWNSPILLLPPSKRTCFASK